MVHGMTLKDNSIEDLKQYAKREISKVMAELEFEMKKEMEKQNVKRDINTRWSNRANSDSK